MQKEFNVLKNVINLGDLPARISDLGTAFNDISEQKAGSSFGFGRVVLNGCGDDARCAFSSILILRDGKLIIENPEGTKIELQKGEVVTLPAANFSWTADAAECVILVFHQDNPTVSFAKLDLDHPMSPGGAPNAALLTTAAPDTARYEFQDEGLLSWGVWATTPYARQAITYSFAEMMMLRKGEVTLSNSEEGSVTFSAGEIFLVLPGAIAAWDNPTDLQKFWVIRSQA